MNFFGTGITDMNDNVIINEAKILYALPLRNKQKKNSAGLFSSLQES